MANLLQVAGYATPLLPGIDWTKVSWWKGEQYAAVLAPEAQLASMVLTGVLSPEIKPEDARGAYDAARAVLKAHAGDVEAAVVHASPTLSTPVELAANVLRDILTVSYYAAYYGMDIHKPENVAQLYQSGVLSAERIKRDADVRHAIFRSMILLEEYGIMDRLRAASGLRGIGALPVAAVVGVTVAVVAAVAIIAWLIFAINDTSETNDLIEAVCREALRSGKPDQIDLCGRLLGDKREKYSWIPGVGGAAAGASKPDDLLNKVIAWGGVITIGYLMVSQMLPRLLSPRPPPQAESPTRRP